MDPGEFNRPGKIRAWEDIPNAAMALDQTFEAGIDRWMKVDPIRGLAIRAGEQLGEQPTHFIWLRWSQQVQASMLTQTHVVEVNGRRYRILDAIDVEDARQFVRITAKDIGPLS